MTTKISSLKSDIVRLTELKKSDIVNCSYPDRNISDLQDLKDEIQRSAQIFQQYKEDEALFKSSTFALINPRPIFPTLPPEAFADSSFAHEDKHKPYRSLLHKEFGRQDSCWAAAHNGPNSFIQVNL